MKSMTTTEAVDPILERMHRAADGLAAYPFKGWFYGDSIGFEGLLAASDLFGDARWSDFARGFIRGWATRAQPYREMDNTVAGRAMCLIAERTGDDVLLAAAAELAGYLRGRPTIGDGAWVSFAQAPLKEPYGGSALAPSESRLLADPGPGVYVDCLHFDPPFMVHLGRLLDDADLVNAGVAQALAYISMLQDPDTSLFYHFWLERTARPYALGWARGQGWALLGLLDVLDELPPDHPRARALLDAMRALAEAMVRLQRPDGSWSAVAQSPESGSEGSTAAFMAAGLRRGVVRGWLDREPHLPSAASAWRATLASTGDDGLLADVSAAVWSSTSDLHYHHVPKGFLVPWGQGPLLLAASSWLGPDERADTTAGRS